MTKNLILGLILAHFVQIWDPKFFFASFTSTSSWTLLQAITDYNFKDN